MISLSRHWRMTPSLSRSFSVLRSAAAATASSSSSSMIPTSPSFDRRPHKSNDRDHTHHKNNNYTINHATHQQQVRYYTPLTEHEQDVEKHRVATLSDFQKDQELRALNREIARLELLRNIHTGELYTWTGRYKQLSRDYGMPLMLYYAACWGVTGISIFALLQVTGVDAMHYIQQVDQYMNWNMSSKIDPQLGTIGLTVVLNELVEPLRLPFVILTVKPVVDRIVPPKF
jgi:hypothetical protein